MSWGSHSEFNLLTVTWKEQTCGQINALSWGEQTKPTGLIPAGVCIVQELRMVFRFLNVWGGGGNQMKKGIS